MYRNFAPRKRTKIAHGHPGPVAKMPAAEKTKAFVKALTIRAQAKIRDEAKAEHKGHAKGRERRAKILAAVASTPLKTKEIAAKTGFKVAITSWYVQNMVTAGQLKVIGRGNASKYVKA